MELFVADGAIVVGVSFCQELIPEVFVVKSATVAGEEVVKVIKSQPVIFIFIKNIESHFYRLFVVKDLSTHTSRDEFLKVDDAVTVLIALLDHLLPQILIFSAQFMMCDFCQLVSIDRARFIGIKSQEFLL